MPTRTKRTTPHAGTTELADSLVSEIQAHTVEDYEFIRTGKTTRSVFDLTAESKVRELEETAGRQDQNGETGKADESRIKAASWGKLSELDELEAFSHSFKALEAVKRNAEFPLIAGQTHPLALVPLGTGLIELVGHISNLAGDGNRVALHQLWLIARGATIALQNASVRQPGMTRALAETLPQWPGFLGPHGDNLKEREEIIGRLNIGAKCPLKVERRWSNKPAKAQAFRHYLGTYVDRAVSIIQSAHRRRDYEVARRFGGSVTSRLPAWLGEAEALPPISTPETVTKWSEVILKILAAAGGGKLGKLPGLANAGEARAGVRQRIGESEKQQRGQAERAIGERLQDAFKARYAPDPVSDI